MDLSSFKLLGVITTPLKWLYSAWLDQTRIDIHFPLAANWLWDSIPVSDSGDNSGLLLFSVTTRSKRLVEVIRIEVHYAAPFQLFDPGNRGFFLGSGTLDHNFPFCMYWNGSTTVRRDVQQGFGLTARFPDRIRDQRIRILVHAKQQHSALGGFLTLGRPRVTTKEYRTRLVSQPSIGFRIPPMHSFSTPQPFLIEHEAWVTTAPGNPLSVAVHSRHADGTASSKRIDIPGG